MSVIDAVKWLDKKLEPWYDPTDGMLYLPEADVGINNASAEIIMAMQAEHGEVWLANVNPLKDGEVIRKAERDEIFYNFCASYCLPCYDAELEKMMKDRLAAPYTGTADDAARLKPIWKRIAELGGQTLVWT